MSLLLIYQELSGSCAALSFNVLHLLLLFCLSLLLFIPFSGLISYDVSFFRFSFLPLCYSFVHRLLDVIKVQECRIDWNWTGRISLCSVLMMLNTAQKHKCHTKKLNKFLLQVRKEVRLKFNAEKTKYNFVPVRMQDRIGMT